MKIGKIYIIWEGIWAASLSSYDKFHVIFNFSKTPTTKANRQTKTERKSGHSNTTLHQISQHIFDRLNHKKLAFTKFRSHTVGKLRRWRHHS